MLDYFNKKSFINLKNLFQLTPSGEFFIMEDTGLRLCLRLTGKSDNIYLKEQNYFY